MGGRSRSRAPARWARSSLSPSRRDRRPSRGAGRNRGLPGWAGTGGAPGKLGARPPFTGPHPVVETPDQPAGLTARSPRFRPAPRSSAVAPDGEREDRAHLAGALDLDRPPHQLDEPLRDGKPQAAPPNGRAAVLSAWEKGLKSRPWSFSEIRSGVLDDEAEPLARRLGLDADGDRPAGVNLTALPMRFKSTCRNRAASPAGARAPRGRSRSGAPTFGGGARRQQAEDALDEHPEAPGRCLELQPAGLDLRQARMSSTSRGGSALVLIASTCSRCSAGGGAEQQLGHADEPFIGVRISWLMLAGNRSSRGPPPVPLLGPCGCGSPR